MQYRRGIQSAPHRDRGQALGRFALTVLALMGSVGMVATVQPLSSQTAASGEGHRRCDTAAGQLPQLTLLNVYTGNLAPGETACIALWMEQGALVRASLDVDSGYIRARVFPPGGSEPLLVNWSWALDEFQLPTLPLAFEAPTSGHYVVELSVPIMSWTSAAPFRMQIHEWISAQARTLEREDLQGDPRTAWLRDQAIPVRSIDPADEDYSDLEFLQEDLRGVRVVLLGEGAPGHGGGSERSAKIRLVKFLHERMGFDVLAFESGLFSTSVAWRALQTDVNPREAFLEGVFRNSAWAEEVQPLIHYLATTARTEHPLELAGFDSQFSGRASQDALLPELQEFLTRTGIGGPLADSDSRLSQILSGTVGRAELLREPEPAEIAELVESMRATAAQVRATVSGRAGEFWAQVLRSGAAQAGLEAAREWGWAYAVGRDRQMVENLIWLVERYYQGHKIIVWAHTFHSIRNPQYTIAGRAQGFTTGHGLWEAIGEESFVIGVTAYEGTLGCITCTEGMDDFRQDIVPDQHSSFEFEELMDAAGHELAWVNLRSARAEGQWPVGVFPARPVYSLTERAPWSELLDALLFIHTQEPSRKVAGVR